MVVIVVLMVVMVWVFGVDGVVMVWVDQGDGVDVWCYGAGDSGGGGGGDYFRQSMKPCVSGDGVGVSNERI